MSNTSLTPKQELVMFILKSNGGNMLRTLVMDKSGMNSVSFGLVVKALQEKNLISSSLGFLSANSFSVGKVETVHTSEVTVEVDKYDRLYSKLDPFRADFNKYMDILNEKYGIKVKLGQLTCRDIEATGRLTITDKSDKAIEKAEATAKEVWENWAGTYNMKPEWFGRAFKAKNKTYMIIGLDPKKPKNVVQLTCDGVAGYHCSSSTIIGFMK